MNALLALARKRLQQVPHELHNGGSGVIAHAIDTEIARLAVFAKGDLQKRRRRPPKGAMGRYPSAALFTLMADTKITRADLFRHHFHLQGREESRSSPQDHDSRLKSARI